MGEYRFPISGDGRPVFTSNGIKVLFATGSDTQVSLLEPEILKEKFGAELIVDNVRLNPYYQVGECTGGIYRLEHFPLDGSEYDFRGLYIFNSVPSKEYKELCKSDGLGIVAVGAVCDIIVGCAFVAGSCGCTGEEWFFGISDVDEAVKKANKYLQEVIDKTK